MLKQHELNRSIESLEHSIWPAPSVDAPSFIVRCHQLRTVPIGQLKAGDLRVLLTQGVGTLHLMPVALEVLASAPLVEGDCYEGDLLSAAILAILGLDEKSKTAFVLPLRNAAQQAIAELNKDAETARLNRKLICELNDFLLTAER